MKHFLLGLLEFQKLATTLAKRTITVENTVSNATTEATEITNNIATINIATTEVVREVIKSVLTGLCREFYDSSTADLKKQLPSKYTSEDMSKYSRKNVKIEMMREKQNELNFGENRSNRTGMVQ